MIGDERFDAYGIPEGTLKKWRVEIRDKGFAAPAGEQQAEQWSTRDKFLIVVETASLSEIEEDRMNNLPKQRHTAKRIYDRLRKEHDFTDGYSTVRQCVRQLKQTSKVFIPLEFDPGEAAQVDWGTAIAYINGQRTDGQRTVIQLFCMRLCHSAAIFVAAFPTEEERGMRDVPFSPTFCYNLGRGDNYGKTSKAIECIGLLPCGISRY